MNIVRFVIPIMLVSPAMARSFFFPHYADGDGFSMKLVISNHSESRARGWLSVFGSDGRIRPLPFDVGETGRVELDLAPHATIALSTNGTSAPIRTGYIEVNADQDAISGLAIFKHANGTEAGIFPAAAGTEFSLYVERTPFMDTGLAVCSLKPTTILLRLFDLNGQLIDTASYDPGGVFQQARFVSQLLRLPPLFQGTLSLKSDGPFVPLGLRFGENVLASLPAISLETISPPAGVAYFTAGRRPAPEP
jgi:hypothetical protein